MGNAAKHMTNTKSVIYLHCDGKKIIKKIKHKNYG